MLGALLTRCLLALAVCFPQPTAVDAARYPATPVPLNTAIPFAAGSVFVPGVQAYFRAVGISGNASYFGPPLAITLPDADLGLPLLWRATRG